MVARGYALLSRVRGQRGHPGRAHRCGPGGVDRGGARQRSRRCATRRCANGYDRLRARRRRPRSTRCCRTSGRGRSAASRCPGESIICPWTTPLAFATEAVARGCSLLLGTRVTGVGVGAEATTLAHRPRRAARTRGSSTPPAWAATTSTACSATTGSPWCRGAVSCSSSTSSPGRSSTASSCRCRRQGQGRARQPDDLRQRHARPDVREPRRPHRHVHVGGGLRLPAGEGRARSCRRCMDEDVTAAYAGLRAATEHVDYVVDVDAVQRYLLLGGIRSTGLTASMALAEHAAELLSGGRARPPAARRPARRPPHAEHRRGVPPPVSHGTTSSPPTRSTAASSASASGSPAARSATRSRSPIPPADLDGLRRRTRAMMGRCQGFYCGAEVDRPCCGARDE